MSNQKTSRLRRLTSAEFALGDRVPVVDVSEETSPSGETKYTTMADIGTYVASGGFVNWALPYQGYQYANGLAFDQSITPASDSQRAFGNIEAVGSSFSIFVHGYVDSGLDETVVAKRSIFGVGPTTSPTVGTQNNVAYVGITENHLFALVRNSVGAQAYIQYSNFFTTNTQRSFVAGVTKNDLDNVTLYVNGVAYASSSLTGSVENTKVVMGNGSNEKNIKCTIYDAHILNRNLSAGEVTNLFYKGIDTTETSLIASYNGNTLNGGPTQWLDAVGSNHILLPTVGAHATNPGKRFILSFPTSGTSQYLGDGTQRDVLPAKYVLTSCIVESDGKPLLSVGSNSATSSVSSSGIGSYDDNRVALVSASYGVNPVGLLALGSAHADRSIYVYFSASAAPCTFSFDGYIRN
jgi:hypothetical protein